MQFQLAGPTSRVTDDRGRLVLRSFGGDKPPLVKAVTDKAARTGEPGPDRKRTGK